MEWVVLGVLACAVITFVAMCCLIFAGNIEREEEKKNAERMRKK